MVSLHLSSAGIGGVALAESSLHLSSAGTGGVALAESQHSGVHQHPEWNHGEQSGWDLEVHAVAVQELPFPPAHPGLTVPANLQKPLLSGQALTPLDSHESVEAP